MSEPIYPVPGCKFILLGTALTSDPVSNRRRAGVEDILFCPREFGDSRWPPDMQECSRQDAALQVHG